LASQHVQIFVKMKCCGCWGYRRSLLFFSMPSWVTFRTRPIPCAGEARPIRQGRNRRRGWGSQRRPRSPADPADSAGSFTLCEPLKVPWLVKEIGCYLSYPN
jgi:hypothetical protein